MNYGKGICKDCEEEKMCNDRGVLDLCDECLMKHWPKDISGYYTEERDKRFNDMINAMAQPLDKEMVKANSDLARIVAKRLGLKMPLSFLIEGCSEE